MSNYWIKVEELAFRTEKVSHTINAINTALDFDKDAVDRYALANPSDELKRISNDLTNLYQKMLNDIKHQNGGDAA